MKLSIIVPAFNEARTIAAVLEAVRAVDLGGLGLEREILVVSDGVPRQPRRQTSRSL